jgi:hypothetical protein
MGNLLVLIDYENFYMSAIQHFTLTITDKGLDHLLEVCRSHGTMSRRNNVVVSAYWDNYRAYRTYFANKSSDIVEVYDRGSNTSDGYLIVRAMQRINEFNEDDTLILIAGDGVYAGLVRYALSLGMKICIYSWEETTADLYKTHSDIKTFFLTDVFGFSTNKHLENNLFECVGITPAEYGIITRGINMPHLFAVATANIIYQNTSDSRYKEIDTYDKATAFLQSCADNGIFHPDRLPNPEKDNKIQKVYILNEDNAKVKIVRSQLHKV